MVVCCLTRLCRYTWAYSYPNLLYFPDLFYSGIMREICFGSRWEQSKHTHLPLDDRYSIPTGLRNEILPLVTISTALHTAFSAVGNANSFIRSNMAVSCT